LKIYSRFHQCKSYKGGSLLKRKGEGSGKKERKVGRRKNNWGGGGRRDLPLWNNKSNAHIVHLTHEELPNQ